MSEDDNSKIKKLGLDEAIEDLKFLAQKVSDMSQDLAQKAADQAEGVTDKMGDIVESTAIAINFSFESTLSSHNLNNSLKVPNPLHNWWINGGNKGYG